MKKILAFLIVFVSFFFLAYHAQALTGCDATFSFCSLQPLPAGAKPGTTCADGNGNYVYGTTNSCGPGQATPCIPHCSGFAVDAWCCQPKPGYTPLNAYPPGCKSVEGGGCASVDTALGVISTSPGGVVKSIMGIMLSLAGGVAILLIIASGYQMVVSQGNPEKVKEGRERLTAAIVGLLFIIFSATILQIIGIDILHIPGLSR